MAHTEEEQIENIKRFIQQHGSKLLLAIVVVIGSYAGYQTWKKSTITAKETASIYYSEIVTIAAQEEKSEADQQRFATTFARLAEEYPNTRYASYAAFAKAQLEVSENKLDQAQLTLQWAKDNSKDKNLTALANLRLARVVASLGDYDKALKLLAEDADSYSAMYEQAKGDIYLLQGEKNKALVAFQKALSLLQQVQGTNTQLLEIKISSLSDADSSKVFPKVNSENP